MKIILFGSIASLSIASLASGSTLVNALMGTTPEGASWSVTNSSGAAGPTLITTSTGAGFGFAQQAGFQLTLTGLATNQTAIIEIHNIEGAEDETPPFTWNGVTNDTTTVAFTADAGTWDISGISVPTTGTALSVAIDSMNPLIVLGSANTTASGNTTTAQGQAISYGEEWGSIFVTGATQITYSSQVNDGGDGYGFTITIIPEPSSTALLGLGGLALLTRRRR